jgi:hypothetical protein
MRGVVQGLESELARNEARFQQMEDLIRSLQIQVARDNLSNTPLLSTEKKTDPRLATPTMSGALPARQYSMAQTYQSEGTPNMVKPAKSKITEKIEPLDDGTTPTYRQWKISVRDRLLVNADHYDTVPTRKALIWGTTTGLARSYLEPRYQSDSPHASFQDHQEMIDLLESYFVTGYETEDARNSFKALWMGEKGHENETFAEFKGRFTSMAILGEIPQSELFYYMWEKITPQLRSAAAVSKRSWNRNLSEMTADLLALDKERRRNNELYSARATSTPSNPTKKSTVFSSTTRTVSKSPIVATKPSSTPTSVQPRPWSANVENRVRSESAQTPNTTIPKCYGCGKPGHYRAQCPSLPTIKEIGQDDESLPENHQDPAEYSDLDKDHEENAEA